MSLASELLGVGFDVLNAVHGGVAGTYAQGANTKAFVAADCTRSKLQRATGPGLDEDTCRLGFKQSFFASGFSGTNPVQPSPGDVVTITSESPWTLVGDADMETCGIYGLETRRAHQRGTA